MSTTAPNAFDRYDFVSPSAVAFGAGRLVELGSLVARFGSEAWLVTSASGLRACGGLASVTGLLNQADVTVHRVATSQGEPTVADVVRGLRGLPSRTHRSPVIVAIGGGAAIDLGKAIAALATNLARPATADEADVIDHLEGVGRNLSIVKPPLPVVAIPTTAGTGAEATRNAVISCPERRLKKSMRSPLMVPRGVIIDPALTVSCPRHVTAAAGLDAITQLIESFVCRFGAAIPRALVLEALPRAIAALPRVLAHPDDLDARSAMSHAAFVSGLALANSGLGMAHGVAAALGIECGTPHGLACALMLPVALAVNREACRDDYALLERAVDPAASQDGDVAADAFVTRVESLCRVAETPRRLSDVGLSRGRIGWLAENSGGASLRGNPVPLDPPTLLGILQRHM